MKLTITISAGPVSVPLFLSPARSPSIHKGEAEMEMIKLTCDKIKNSRFIPGFNGLHTRAILCFMKYKKLNLIEITMLMDEHKNEVKKILDDLVKLKIINYKSPNFIMPDPFEALFRLVTKAEKQTF